MNNLKITSNHPIKKRKILGPIGRFVLKLINWKIVGNLPDKKRIIIASAPHSSTFDSIYAFFVCLATDLKFYFLGSVSMFTRIVVPLPFKKNLSAHSLKLVSTSIVITCIQIWNFGFRFNNFKTLLSLSLTSTFPITVRLLQFCA